MAGRRFYLGMPESALKREGETLKLAICRFTGWEHSRVVASIQVEPQGIGIKLNFNIQLDGQDPVGDDQATLDRFFAEARVNGKSGQIGS